MSLTCSSSSQVKAEWTRLFPSEINTYTSSIRFMKQLTTIAISAVTYNRCSFPDDCYLEERFAGLLLKVLKKNCNNENAQFVSAALMQSFQAFDKKYVHKLALCFYDGDYTIQENLIESWIFEYVYKDDTVSMNVHSKSRDKIKQTNSYTFDNIKETVNIIRGKTLEVIKSLIVVLDTKERPIKEDVDISFRLYYNENAPDGYQAPGFSSVLEDQDHLDPILDKSLKVAHVETDFHELKIGNYTKEEFNSLEVNVFETQPKSIQMEQEFESPVRTPSYLKDSDQPFRCPCIGFDNFSPGAILTCSYCNTVQHAACFGIRREWATSVLYHCCTFCSDADPTRKPTDQMIAELHDANKRKVLCLYRCLLERCTQMVSISIEDVMVNFPASKDLAFGLLKMSHKKGIIKEKPVDNITDSYEINHNNLANQISQYFHNKDNSGFLDEALSQRYESGPVKNALGPSETESLQNAYKMCKVIEPVQMENKENDALKEYRDAILTLNSDDADLPITKSKTGESRFRKQKIRKGDPLTEVKAKRIRKGPQ